MRRAEREVKRARKHADRMSGRTRTGNAVYRATEPTVANMRSEGERLVSNIGDSTAESTAKIGAAGNEAARKLERTFNTGSRKAARNIGVGVAGGLSVPIAVNHGLGAWRDRANRRDVRG